MLNTYTTVGLFVTLQNYCITQLYYYEGFLILFLLVGTNLSTFLQNVFKNHELLVRSNCCKCKKCRILWCFLVEMRLIFFI